jgi:hypothetical protein
MESAEIFFEPCFVGGQLNDACHLLVYCRKKGFLSITDLSDDDRQLLLWRTGIESQPSSLERICLHHEALFLSRYESIQKFCCDPFNVHTKRVTKSLRVIDTALAEKLHAKPGQKLCKACQQKAKNDSDSESCEEYLPEEQSMTELNDSVLALGCSPLKLKSTGDRDKLGYAKSKVQRMHEATKAKMASALSIPADLLESPVEPECTACTDLDKLVSLL